MRSANSTAARLPGPQSIPASSRGDDIDSRIIRAARNLVIAQGIDGATMAAIARGAQISRPTLYARYSSREAVIGQLLNDEIVGLLELVYPLPSTVDEFIHAVVTTAEHAVNSDFLVAVVRHNPDALVTYQYQRLGRSQKVLIRFIKNILVKLQRTPPAPGTYPIRMDDPTVMATFILATAQSLALLSWALSPVLPSESTWKRELTQILEGYLYSWPAPSTTPLLSTPSDDAVRSTI